MLRDRIELVYQKLSPCKLCPRKCGVDRLNGETGFCGMGKDIYISSYGPHFGEEPELVGRFGSGTIFFTGCNLKCCFCQNYEISHLKMGYRVEVKELANIMLKIQNMGCHNINLVTPTHFSPQIISAILMARDQGLRLPVIYNCGGYELVETLKLLEGFIDIYMPDVKFLEEELSKKYCSAPDYPQVVKQALREMHRQVKDLKINSKGLAEKGLLIRHLIMPNNLKNTEKVLKFIAEEISLKSYVNIMEQYYPCYQAYKFPELRRRISTQEYYQAINLAQKLGLYRGF